MNLETDDKSMFNRYLLGISDQPEQVMIEERLLRDMKFYEELLIAEDDLVDEYLAGELSSTQRDSFENNFLVTPERLQKLRFARGLNRYVAKAADAGSTEELEVGSSTPSKTKTESVAFLGFFAGRNLLARYAFAAVVLLAFGSAVWFAFRSTQSTSSGRVLSVTLTPGITRGDNQTTEIHLEKDVAVVELRLALPRDEYQAYRAELEMEGRTLLAKEDLKSETRDGKLLVFNVDASTLIPGDYQVRVSGGFPDQPHERLQSYQFRIRVPDRPN